MKKQPQQSARTRAQIIAELATLPSAIQGKICEDRRTLASGETAIYHNLQYWANGKNHTYRIPAGKVAQFREAVKNGAKARELLNELTHADTQTILSSKSPLKKKLAQQILKGAARLHAIVDHAAESVEKHGIACTRDLEKTLFDEMNGLCRNIMHTILSEGAATYSHYDPEESERHGGNHSKRFCTRFGMLPPIKRPYYYDEDSGKGHYPFDDKIGAMGRYTPAFVEEVIRTAADHPYGDAAKEFSSNHGFKVSADTIRSVILKCSRTVKEFMANNGLKIPNEDDANASLVYIMADGTGIPFRKKHLKNVKGKNGRAKTREVKAASFFIGSKSSDNKPHRNIDTTTYIATTEKKEKFGKEMRREFDRRFKHNPATTVFISDGAKWLHKLKENHFPCSIEILDYYHAVEHLKPLMLAIGFKETTKEWKTTHRNWRRKIANGKVESLVDLLWKNYKDKLGKDGMREFKYFRENSGRMKYNEYRAKGLFIGSGVIESACKTMVGKRFKESGMLWSPKGANALLPLRALFKSNRLEEFAQYMVKDLEQVKCCG